MNKQVFPKANQYNSLNSMYDEMTTPFRYERCKEENNMFRKIVLVNGYSSDIIGLIIKKNLCI